MKYLSLAARCLYGLTILVFVHSLNLESTFSVASSGLKVSKVKFLNQTSFVFHSENSVDEAEHPQIFNTETNISYEVPGKNKSEVSTISASAEAIYIGDVNSTVTRYYLEFNQSTRAVAMDPLHTKIYGIETSDLVKNIVYSVGTSGKICRQNIANTVQENPKCALAHSFNSTIIHEVNSENNYLHSFAIQNSQYRKAENNLFFITTGGDKLLRFWNSELLMLKTVVPSQQQSMITAIDHSR